MFMWFHPEFDFKSICSSPVHKQSIVWCAGVPPLPTEHLAVEAIVNISNIPSNSTPQELHFETLTKSIGGSCMKVWIFKIQDHVWQYSPLLKREQSTDSLEPGTTAIYTFVQFRAGTANGNADPPSRCGATDTMDMSVAGEGGRSEQCG